MIGSFDGAEMSELVGLYIQWKLENMISKTNFGLYRLILLTNLNGQEMDKKKKNYHQNFQENWF